VRQTLLEKPLKRLPTLNRTYEAPYPMNKQTNSRKAVSLGVSPPADISLAVEGAPSWLKAKLVGLNPGQYLIITPPTPGQIVSGNPLEARYIREGAIWGFKTSVLKALKEPFPLIFLSYPKTVQRHELRKKERAKCYIPAKVIFMNDGFDVVISDINTSGCRFTYRTPSSAHEDGGPVSPGERLRLMIGDEMTFDFRMPGEPQERSCLGRVRNFAQHTDKIVVGAQFMSLTAELSSAIKKYMEQIRLL